MAKLLGEPVAKKICFELLPRVALLAKCKTVPQLCIVRVGERPDDIYYEKSAVKRCASVGVMTRKLTLPQEITQRELLLEIDRLNEDASVHGVLLLRPLPKQLDEDEICERLCAEKDIDCIKKSSLAGVFCGDRSGFAPCTAQACLELLDFYNIETEGKNVAVVGRSLVIGKPVAMLLLSRNATVTVCHTRTKKLAEICGRSDIVVAAAGKAKMLGKDCFFEGQTVLDVGINPDAGGSVCGDADCAAAVEFGADCTPVPGGIGAVTTAVLAQHVVRAAEMTTDERACAYDI
ncbi:MAG: bifunctional 5,10-methylenetetrahydrofolate dehydrogenase/5,10-methenyltetrahydrofolate cyclohydrolase [Oscillospiraceae bacterium]